MHRPTPMNLALAVALTGLLAGATTTHATPSRSQVEIENTLAALGERGQLPLPGDPPLELSAPARERWELGAVLDLAAQGEGLPVLAVSPGGPAAAMGLAEGDRVLAINGQALSGGSEAAGRLARSIAARDGALSIDVARGDARTTLAGQANSVTVPGYSLRVEPGGAPGSTCGQVRLLVINRPSENLFGVSLLGINGRAIFDARHPVSPLVPGRPLIGLDEAIPTTRRQVFTLAPGRHEIGLDELIPGDQFWGGENYQRQRARDRLRTQQILVLDVEPGVDYQIAARLLPREARDVRGGRYWEPVVAAQRARACRGPGIAAPKPGR